MPFPWQLAPRDAIAWNVYVPVAVVLVVLIAKVELKVVVPVDEAVPNCAVAPVGRPVSPAVGEALALLRQAGLPERVMIDFSHDNSGKDPARQVDVARDVAAQVAGGQEAIIGAMLESFLVAGRQELARGELTYGQSITDGCLGWEGTADVLDDLAAAVRDRRSALSLPRRAARS